MAMQEKGGFCATCSKHVMVRRKGTSHLLHLVLSVFTFGLWIIVWILVSVKFGGWRCTQCGGTNVSQVA